MLNEHAAKFDVAPRILNLLRKGRARSTRSSIKVPMLVFFKSDRLTQKILV
jgi:hypothetical protein